jgi:two-component system NarL family response regulator
MTGIDAIDAILRCSPEAHIVVITALQDPELIARAIEAGASGFISKSRAADELLDVVRRAAAGEMVLPRGQAIGILQQLQRLRRRDAAGIRQDDLSAREIEVLQLFAEGLTSPEVAARLFISNRTVQSHVRSVLRKLAVHSKLQAVLWALRRGLIHLRTHDDGAAPRPLGRRPDTQKSASE